MIIVESIAQMQDLSRSWKQEGLKVSVVPTMGALHEGHLSLVKLAGEKAEKVVVTIFVNPTQFAPGEDLDKYPRTFDQDKSLCEDCGAAAIFYPTAEEMYPVGSSSSVIEEQLSLGFCGASRPTHFRGVVTIVAKLFNAVLPDSAIFGEKDYQQLQVLRRMTRDLNFPIEIVPGKIWREDSGLAMSSRNRYLSENEKESALAIYKGLQQAAEQTHKGSDLKIVREQLCDKIIEAGGQIDYVETVDAETLEKVDTVNGTVRCLVAAHFGPARLLDNIQLY